MKKKILLVGSGGREHALAWALRHSPQVETLFVAPGNGGTATLPGVQNVPIAPGDFAALRRFARENGVALVVVGPEEPLANGIVDAFAPDGIPVFGPTRAAARLEGSKAFAKGFMERHAIPTARGASFDDYEQAVAWLAQQPFQVVVKASGLAAGKGVIVCDSHAEAQTALRGMLLDGQFGAAGATVVLEERLHGREISLLAFCDGKRAVPLLPARDHKRALDGDAGPNTGGMGVIAPPEDVSADLVTEIVTRVIEPAVAGMAAEGTPYVGVLYAGVMLTADGIRVLEFNCRFGDPETQGVLPLLDCDLVTVLEACVEGRLSADLVRFHDGSAVTVVLASGGYPGPYTSGHVIHGLDQVPDDALVFHAGTRRTDEGDIVTAGGRVLAVTALAGNVAAAAERAYAALAAIHFDGMHCRCDIGRSPASAYQQAGVDIAAGHRATDLFRQAVEATHGPEVLAGIGAFGGLYSADALTQIARPVLVASTDGVGTKTKVAARLNRWDSIGHDIVNHCVNDILVQGARPLFFLDYVASARLDPAQIAQIVSGVAAACREAGCALLGGETAEMPGVYCDGAVDLVGTIVGVVALDGIVDGRTIVPGDILIGMRSSGLHTNGYTLARRALDRLDWEAPHPDLGGATIGDRLLAPHRSYLPLVDRLRRAGVPLRGLAHITGGGLTDNLPRILPEGTAARIDRTAWEVPAIFRLIQREAAVADDEMFHVFNMGIGMVAVVPPDAVAPALQVLGEDGVIIGRIESKTETEASHG